MHLIEFLLGDLKPFHIQILIFRFTNNNVMFLYYMYLEDFNVYNYFYIFTNLEL